MKKKTNTEEPELKVLDFSINVGHIKEKFEKYKARNKYSAREYIGICFYDEKYLNAREREVISDLKETVMLCLYERPDDSRLNSLNFIIPEKNVFCWYSSRGGQLNLLNRLKLLGIVTVDIDGKTIRFRPKCIEKFIFDKKIYDEYYFGTSNYI